MYVQGRISMWMVCRALDICLHISALGQLPCSPSDQRRKGVIPVCAVSRGCVRSMHEYRK